MRVQKLNYMKVNWIADGACKVKTLIIFIFSVSIQLSERKNSR